jgi:hypothetical protein
MTNAKTQRSKGAAKVRRVFHNAPREARGLRKLHPERMRSLSPGLRGTSYPGFAAGRCLNPARVASSDPLAGIDLTRTGRCRRLIQPLQGWRFISVPSPRVARGSQPWAERSNPFGIGVESPLTGVAMLSVRSPRVARGSQPWAERSNPFGIAVESGPGLGISGLLSCRPN